MVESLPTSTAPASERRAASVASRSGTRSAYGRAPSVVRTPRVSTTSFSPYGMPCIGARLARLGARPLGGHGDEAAEAGRERVDAGEAGLDELHRRERPRADPLRERRDAREEDVLAELRHYGSPGRAAAARKTKAGSTSAASAKPLTAASAATRVSASASGAPA